MKKKKDEITIRSSAAEYLTYVASVGDQKDSVEMRYEDENIWLTQKMMATEEIKKYVAEYNDGMKVSNLYIAQVKRKCGIELAENFNIPRSEGAKQPQCPKEKEEAIIGALKAFQMI